MQLCVSVFIAAKKDITLLAKRAALKLRKFYNGAFSGFAKCLKLNTVFLGPLE